MDNTSRNFWDYVSFPDREERDRMACSKEFSQMQISPDELGYSKNLGKFSWEEPKLYELMCHFNNKVVETSISYAMSIHYINIGVSELPYTQSIDDQNNGYKYANRFWFAYYTDVFFVQMQATWDILLDILNQYYGYSFDNDQRITKRLLKAIKKDHPEVSRYIDEIWNSPIFQTIHQYRVNSAHSTSSINVRDTVDVVKSDDREVMQLIGPGVFEKPSVVVKNMDDYIIFAIQSIHNLLNKVLKENSHA